MAIRGASSSRIPSPAVARLVLAAVLTVGSFLAQYERYHGSCMIPDSCLSLAAFAAISASFVVGFVWLSAEVVQFLNPRVAWPLDLCVGLVAYAVVGAGVWIADPNTAVVGDPGADFRLVMSAGWSWGLLFEAGAFSDYSCGY